MADATRALLQAAAWTGSPAAGAARDWLTAANLDRLPSEHHPLVSLALSAIEAAAPGHPWLRRLRGMHRRAWYMNQLTVRAAARVIDAVSAAGIPLMLTRGLPLALRDYAVRLRPIGTLACVVPRQRAEDARTVLRDLGWAETAGATGGACGACVWESRRRLHIAEGLVMELHWRGAPWWPSDAADAAAWVRARSMVVGGRTVLAAGRADLFVDACARAARRPTVRLMALADMAALLALGDLDWEAVVRAAEESHLGNDVGVACSALSDALGLAVPTDVLARAATRPAFLVGVRIDPARAPRRGGATPVWAIAAVWAEYRRTAEAWGLRSSVTGFLDFLRHRWRCPDTWKLTRAVAARAWRSAGR